MADIVSLKVVKKVEENESICNTVLNSSKDILKQVLVVGYDHNDDLFVCGSTSDKRELLFLIKEFENNLMNGEFD